MKLEERITKIETELRILCDKLKLEISDYRTFKRLLVRELRQNGFIALDDWQQRNHEVDILAWKHGLAVAIRLRQGEEYCTMQVEDLQAVVHENKPDRYVVRVLLHLESAAFPDEVPQVNASGCIYLVPGDLSTNSTPIAPLAAPAAAEVVAGTDGEFPF